MIFDIAKKVAYAACELDWLRKVAPQTAALEAEKHINTLHECAMVLAGKRAKEIYTDPYDFPADQQGKTASEPCVEPPGSSNVIEFNGQWKHD